MIFARMTVRSFISSLIIVLAALVASVSAQAAVTFNVPATDDDGNFTISWSGARSFAELYVLNNGQPVGSPIYGGGGSGTFTFNVTGKPEGTYQYGLKECQAYGSPSGTTYQCDFFSKTIIVSFPAIAPTNVSASVSGTSINLSWTASNGATSYEIQRNNVALTTTVNTNHTDTTATPGTAYTYKVRACKSSTNCSAWVSSSSVTIPAIPVAPTSINASPNGLSVSLSWSASSGANSYELQRNNTTINTLSATSYIDAAGSGTFTYRVRACNGTGCSGWTTSSQVVVAIVPAQPSSLSASISGPAIALNWAAVTGATSYEIQRNSSTLTSTSGVSYTDSTAIPGTAYTYQIRACSSAGCSAWRASSSITTPVVPAIPTSISVTMNGANVVINWAISSGTSSYELQKNSAALTSGSTTGYTDSAVALGSSYTYRVRACNTTGCSGWKTASAFVVPHTAFDFGTQAPSMFAYSLTTAGVPNVGSNQMVATTQGNLNVSNGAAGYSIPLELPPAVRDLKPKLSINYNSRSGNGLMGVGWNLGGLSSISRCRAGFATEGAEAQKSNPRYTIGDRLCLDGQKLVIASSSTPANNASYWTAGTEYKTEIDSFTKVVAYSSSANGGHGYFKAYTKDGRILTYGEQATSQNSKIYATNQYGGPVSSWALDKVEDAYGNTYTIAYEQNNTNGEYYPSQIQLGSTGLVVFTYKTRSGQTPWGYDVGNKYQLNKILEKVTTYVGTSTSTPIKEYRVNYQLSATTNRELVDTIYECGYESSTWKCARPLTFDWQEGELGFDPTPRVAQTTTGNGINHFGFDDVNGDGYVDSLSKYTVFAWGTSSGQFIPSGYNTDEVNNSVAEINFKSLQLLNSRVGKVGIVTKSRWVYSELKEYTDIYLAKFNSNSTTVSYTLLKTIKKANIVPLIGDFNNDGLDDFLLEHNLWLQNYAAGSPIFNDPLTTSDDFEGTEATPIDFNNDGLKDLTFVIPRPFQYESDLNQTSVLYGYESNATSIKNLAFSLIVSPTVMGEIPGDPNQRRRPSAGMYRTFADLNGDGLKDYVYQHFIYSLTTNKYQIPDYWYVAYSNGKASTPFIDAPINTNVPVAKLNNVRVGSISLSAQYAFNYDYNKDGLEDLILLKPVANLWKWSVFTTTYVNGQLTLVDTDIDPFFNNATELASAPKAGEMDNMFRGDMNNDGLIDIVFTSGKYFAAKQQQPDLINKITDGFGVVTELSYSPLTDDANNGQPLYTPETTAPTFPQMPVNRGMQVVKKISTSNGQGGFNHTYYNYHGGRQDIHRGFAGFKSLTITNATTGVSSISEYRQDWPYNGRISKQTVKDSSGKLVSVVNNAYTIHSQNARFPYLQSSLQKSYELTTISESAPISVSKTMNTFDTCGNITEQTTKIGKGFSGAEITGELSNQRVVNLYDDYGTTNNCSDDFLETSTQTISKAGGANLKTIVTEFTPNPQRDILTRTAFKNESIQSTTTYAYEANGVVKSITEVAKDMDGTSEPVRITSFSNFANGIYPQTITNAKGHQATLTYDYRFGAIKTETVLGQTTTNYYDALGRQYAVQTPDSAITQNTSFYCSSAPVTCPSGAYYGVATRTTHSSQAGKLGSPLSITFYDALQREVRSVSYSLDGKVVNQATEYLNSGYLNRVSEPYATNGIYADSSSASAWTAFSNYDSLGRANTVTGADGGSKTTTYATSTDGLIVTDSILVIKPNGGSDIQTSSRSLNALGQVVKVEDALFNTVNYVYDSMGNLETTQVNNNVATQITIDHDLAGNKTYISDPDAGNINFAYNGFGELRKQTWQQGVSGVEKSISWDYDQLGRQISRLDKPASGSTVAYDWTWDTRQQGQLSTRSGNGFTEDYYYDGFSRLSRQVVATAGLSGGEFIYTYDNFSRPVTMTYPNGFKIQRDYHAAGYQTKTSDITTSASPQVLWALGNTIDTRGNFNNQLWGNGVVTQTGFDSTSGRLSNIKSGRLSGTNQVTNLYGDIQNLSYTFDSLGNLHSRTTARTNNSGAVQENITENFAYDKLNRLTTSTTSGLFGRTQTYQYDTGGLGNLTNRTDTLTGTSTNNDVGTLAYDRVRNAGIHAVTSAGGINYSYDKYGNMTARGSETLTYDVFNKPTRIAGSTTTDFFYGPDHELYKQVSGSSTTYKLAGGVYEVTVNGSTTTQKSYVDGVILNTRTLTNGTQTANDTQYLHSDHIGSTESITNALGQFVNRMSFSTWGERQKPDWKTGPLTSTELNTYDTITTNGYTGHDQLDSHNLIHMGGRVYDPNLGRFLSADLFIQSPYNSQSFNRYSYTFNNPLSYTDPSGYMSDIMQYMMNYTFQQSQSFMWSSDYAAAKSQIEALEAKKQAEKMYDDYQRAGIISDYDDDIPADRWETTSASGGTSHDGNTLVECGGGCFRTYFIRMAMSESGLSPSEMMTVLKSAEYASYAMGLAGIAKFALRKASTETTKKVLEGAADDSVTIIGETMHRVENAASKIPNAKILNDMPDFKAKGLTPTQVTSEMMRYNRKWLYDQIRSGRSILDIGKDPNRIIPSIFYRMEQNLIKNYQKMHPEWNGVTKI